MPANPIYANTSQPLSGVSTMSTINKTRQNKQWYVRLSMVNNAIVVAPSSTIINPVGFDTLDFNTYQALGDTTYSLLFTGATIGGKSYPYTTTTLPSYGIYDVSFQGTFNDSAAGTAMTVGAYILKNGSPQMINYNNSIGAGSPNFQSGAVRDVFECNPGDQISAGLLLTTQSGGSLTLLASDNITSMLIRYCGTG